MGCIAAGATAEATECLADYALLFGRCFQIRDDIFDYFRSETVGKPTGNDLREGKVSLPLLLTLGRETPGRDGIVELLKKDSLSDAEIDRIQDFARTNGGIDAAYDVMRDLRRRACERLSAIPDGEVRRQLGELFDFVIERQY